MREWRSESVEDTGRIAAEIAAELPAGAIVELSGNLGAGKTTLTKGLVAAWGVVAAEEVTSPTFAIIHEYGEPAAVYHIDLYRLETVNELIGLGLDEIFESGARVLIEWGEKFPEQLPLPRWTLSLKSLGEQTRWITLERSTSPVRSPLAPSP
ncbi:MAG: tRNA (adenosine(37)-N6)-threonylcarbamoyltransferase complex ATPase subunit type 1 TsaE [Acidobacteria bacterium]|nr:tRNA (adenosine(37)-N6)-threonylcarbamoyltransferase complex ATPase subunit type 1 TsaE [Acidobacteriota bacterium]